MAAQVLSYLKKQTKLLKSDNLAALLVQMKEDHFVKVRTMIKRDFENVFADGIDTILTPATPSAAFGIADQDMANDPVKMYLNDIFTVTVNMAGLPGISVPAGLNPKGLPLGLQLIGKPFEEETLFRTAAVMEQAAGRFTPEKWW